MIFNLGYLIALKSWQNDNDEDYDYDYDYKNSVVVVVLVLTTNHKAHLFFFNHQYHDW